MIAHPAARFAHHHCREPTLFADLIHSIQPGIALLSLVLALLCVRHRRESGEAGIGWLAVSSFAYVANHQIAWLAGLPGGVVFLIIVLTASVALSALLVGLRLFAAVPSSRPLSSPRILFPLGTLVFAILIMAAARVGPLWVHLVPGAMLAYAGLLQWRMARAHPGLGYGYAAVVLFSHPVAWLILVLLDVAPIVVRDTLSLPYVAAGYALLSVTLSRANRDAARATQSLRDAEARWSFALDGSSQGVWDWDLPSGSAYYSPRLNQMLGEAVAGAVRSPARWFEPLHPDDVLGTRASLNRHLAGETPSFDVEYRVRRQDGSDAWFETRGKVITRSPSGEALRMIGTFTDITVRKAAELALAESLRELEERKRQVEQLNAQLARRAIDAETAVRAKDAFLRNVTHEFRTPMNHIMGAANLLSLSPLDEKQLKWLTMILDGARNLLKRIDATIDIARIEAGGLTLESVDFGPATVLAETCGMLAHRAREKGLALQVTTAPDVPAVLKGDPTRLAQMVLNFLDNAIKFTEQGFVRVSATCVARDGAGVALRVEVADSGPGIPVELQASLFTPFAPGDPSVTRRHGGLGVGLSTTREIARLMGGDAGVSSEPGKGSTFWLSARFLPGKPD